LHPIGTSFSGVFGQLPAIFALDRTQDPLQILECSLTGLWSSKASSNAGVQMGQGLCPLHNLGWGRVGFHKGDMLVVLHGLLLSHELSERYFHLSRVSHVEEKFLKPFSCVLRLVMDQLKKCDCSEPTGPQKFSKHFAY
jgi:hypothetical protein